MSNNTLDAGIPVLTEIIPAPAIAETDGANAPETPAAPLDAPLPDKLPGLVRLSTEKWDDAEWGRLERQVRERVLAQILDRVDLVLEQRVRDSLADVLQVSVARLASEIREGLHQSLRDAVERAVTQEIAIVQASNK